jgi:5'-nucleotidase
MQTLESLPVIVTRRAIIAVLLTILVAAGCSSDNKTPAAAPSGSASSSASTAPSSAAATRPLRILVSNDDGVSAPGIDALVTALAAEPATEVTVVAPAANQSGAGSKTSPGPLTASKATTASGYPATAVDGFPADSVVYGLHTVLTAPPDLVITGINAGQNIGPAIDLSGTVGAARAAAQEGIPAVAVSAGFPDPFDFATGAKAAIDWLHDHRSALLESHAAPTTVANINVPTCTSGSVRGQVEVTPDPAAALGDAIAPADCTSTQPAPTTDVAAFHNGFVTISEVGLKPAS